MILVGQRFHRWIVISACPKSRHQKYLCRCDCGMEKAVVGTSLTSDGSKSCGCLRREVGKEMSASNFKNKTHGQSRTPVFQAWVDMLKRCNDPKHKSFRNYGGRGITVAPEFKDFAAFYKEIGPKPSPAHTLDRIDNNKGYIFGNIRWATQRQQMANVRKNISVTFQGETLIVAEWARRIGIDAGTLGQRLKRWPVEKAMTTPVRA